MTSTFIVMDAPVPFRFRHFGPDELVDGGAAEVVSVREQVPVGIHRLGEGCVAQAGLNDLRVKVRGDQRARIEVPQVVESGPGQELVRGIGTGLGALWRVIGIGGWLAASSPQWWAAFNASYSELRASTRAHKQLRKPVE
jgi:hypothetical protein